MSEGPTATVPDGKILYAIGDIHGRSDLLAELLALIERDAARFDPRSEKTLIFVGDYVDRGPDSRGVIELLCHGLPSGFGAVFLKGNHEAFLLGFLKDPALLGAWRQNGGEHTLRSYGVDPDRLDGQKAAPETWRDTFSAALPAPHWDFLRDLRLSYEAGDYLFVHAGVRPGVPLDVQDPDDLLWIRDAFLKWDEPFGKIVVHGHTPERNPAIKPNRIGIDTGAVLSGRLTALRLKGRTVEFLQTGP